MSSRFEVFPTFTAQGTPVTLAKSKSTKLQVALVSADGPMCNLYATVATEALSKTGVYHCDDGLPHTLEHLIFLGSKKYPYKGILDKLANRCLAQGTNAWTDVDSTAYTVTTAGSEAFLNLLPIYLDHILNPTITDEGFVTEVHHVNENGEDKGVVYCEMQGRENSDGDILERACLAALYPDEDCGYKSETGGKMSNLRSLRVDQVRRYHSEYYRPSNLFLLVTGSMPLEELLEVVGKVDQEYEEAQQAKKATGPGADKRPWSRPVAPMPQPPKWGPVEFTPPPLDDDDDDDDDGDEDGGDDSDDGGDDGGDGEGKRDDDGGGDGEEREGQEKDGGGAGQDGEKEAAAAVMLEHMGVSVAQCCFPSQDESVGTVVLAWRTHEEFPAPQASTSTANATAAGGGGGGGDDNGGSCGSSPRLGFRSVCLDVLLNYLNDSAASPVQRAFVESPSSAFVSDCFHATEVFKCGYLQLWFEGVESARLGDVLPLFLHTLNTALRTGEGEKLAEEGEHEEKEKKEECGEGGGGLAQTAGSGGGGVFDMERMAGVIANKRRRYLSAMEDSPADMLVTPLIKHFLYANPANDDDDAKEKTAKALPRLTPEQQVASLSDATDTLAHLEVCSLWTAEQWAGLAREQFLERPLVCVEGRPSSARVVEIEQATEAREAETRGKLGQEKLQQRVAAVASAQEANTKEIPEAILRSVPLPSTHGIPFFPIKSFRTAAATKSTGKAARGRSMGCGGVVALGDANEEGAEVKGGGEGSSPSSSPSLLASLNASFSALATGPTPLRLGLPFGVQVDHVASEFLRLELSLDTSVLTPCQRLWLPLLDEVAFKLATTDPQPATAAAAASLSSLKGAGGDGFLSAANAVSALERELVSYSSAVGFGGGSFTPGAFGQQFRYSLKVEKGELGLAVAWLRRVLFGTRLDPARLTAGCQSLLGSIPEWKRSARSVASAAMTELLGTTESNSVAMTPIRQQQFLKLQLKSLKAGGAEAQRVVGALQAVRGALLAPLLLIVAGGGGGGPDGGHVPPPPRLRVAGDFLDASFRAEAGAGAGLFATLAGIVPRLPPPTSSSSSSSSPSSSFTPEAVTAAAAALRKSAGKKSPQPPSSAPTPTPTPFPWSREVLSTQGRKPTGRSVVVGLSSIENSHVLAAAPGVGWGHPDEAALAVAMEYLEALEGEFWVQIRGAGLAYGCSLALSREQGLVFFSLSRCADPFKAYSAAARIVRAYVPASSSSPPPKALAAVELENAKSSLCSATLGAWEAKSGALSDCFKAWWFLDEKKYKAHNDTTSTSSSSAAAADPPPSTAAEYRRDFMRRIEAVTPEQVLHAMATYLAPLFCDQTSTLAVASPAADLKGVAKEFGLKGALACVFCPSGEDQANRVVGVAEKDLDAMFPLAYTTAAATAAASTAASKAKAAAITEEPANGTDSSSSSSSSASGSIADGDDDEDDGGGYGANEAPWPVGRQAVWRTHRTAFAGAALTAVTLLGLGALFAAKARRVRH